jgi:Tfp pilus assembly protein PilO
MSLVIEKRPGLRLPALPKKPAGGRVPRSQRERLWLIGGGTIAVLMAVVAYFFFISPQRSETSDVQSRVDSAQSQNAELQSRLDQLREQYRNMSKYKAELVAAQEALPSNSGVSDFLRALQSLGGQTQTNVISLTVGQPTDVSAIAAGQPAAAAGAKPTAAAGAPAGGVNPNAVAAAENGVAGPASGAKAGSGANPQVYALPITAQITGSPADLTRFLDQLQNVQPRAVLITSLLESTGVAGAPGAARPAANAAAGATTLQLSMQAFVAPLTPLTSASPTGSK